VSVEPLHKFDEQNRRRLPLLNPSPESGESRFGPVSLIPAGVENSSSIASGGCNPVSVPELGIRLPGEKNAGGSETSGRATERFQVTWSRNSQQW
jgi:hypothetical protein